ncbi:4-hydroxy-tetrahydrodipicolinate reductase [Flavobacterium sp. LAR06]|uniref:4-hydroxy-tetrahydrodipicolinate reductase n=1 Tax=Flavobacterium sp. LAR06 TaxID=3064897 RepID=UPI0035C175D6
MKNIILIGKNGKMAKLLYETFQEDSNYKVLGYLSYKKSADSQLFNEKKVFNSLSEIEEKEFTILDFSHRSVTSKLLTELSKETRCYGLIIGTSGLNTSDFELMNDLSKRMKIFHSSNFSEGMFIFQQMLGIVLSLKLENWNARIHDFHHSNKLDSPSATALELFRMLQHLDPKSSEISYTRIGDGVSEHTVYLHGIKERIDLVHKILDRKTFVPSIEKAVAFLQNSQAGMYGMKDLFNLNSI